MHKHTQTHTHCRVCVYFVPCSRYNALCVRNCDTAIFVCFECHKSTHCALCVWLCVCSVYELNTSLILGMCWCFGVSLWRVNAGNFPRIILGVMMMIIKMMLPIVSVVVVVVVIFVVVAQLSVYFACEIQHSGTQNARWDKSERTSDQTDKQTKASDSDTVSIVYSSVEYVQQKWINIEIFKKNQIRCCTEVAQRIQVKNVCVYKCYVCVWKVNLTEYKYIYYVGC